MFAWPLLFAFPDMVMKRLSLALLAVLFLAPALCAEEKEEWVSLFNGKDLTGWVPKIRHHKAGENWKDTFRVVDGLLTVSYDQYDKFDSTFGHLFYEKPFGNYRLRLEYRFIGDQISDGPGWATRNSGIMVHGESPNTMAIDQDFPASIEVQLLGGLGSGMRTTGNLCTPGTNVEMGGKLVTRHCTSAKSKTYNGDQWVTCEVEVRGGEVVKHIINGETVLEYQKPQLDLRDAHAKELADKLGDKILKSGTISLQSESHPCQFRKIEILEISP